MRTRDQSRVDGECQPDGQDLPQSGNETKDAAWAVDNCHVLARREIRRLQLALVDNGGTGTTPASVAIDTWRHIVRICERTGFRAKGVLRESK